ncbi:MAG: transporter, partial [Psychromonas sp.]
YSYSDNNRVYLEGYSFLPAIVVGVIDIREIKRHSFTASITARYGLTNRWDFDIKLPYIVRTDTQRSRAVSVSATDDEIFNADGNNIGDVELSTHFQLNDGADGGLIYVANLAATIPTGTSPFDVDYVTSTAGSVFPTELPTGSGYFSVQPSLTAIYPTDPGVLYGNISYGYNMHTYEDIDDTTPGDEKVDPGDSIGVSFGLGLSLNERTSMSFGYSHKHVLGSKIDGETIESSELDIGQLAIGYSFNYSQRANLNLSLNIGVTDDAPDVSLNVRVPMVF